MGKHPPSPPGWAPQPAVRSRHFPRVDAALPGPPPRTAGLMPSRGTQDPPPGAPEVHTIRAHAKHVRTARTRRAAPRTRLTRATEPDPTVVLLETQDSKQTQLTGPASSHNSAQFRSIPLNSCQLLLKFVSIFVSITTFFYFFFVFFAFGVLNSRERDFAFCFFNSFLKSSMCSHHSFLNSFLLARSTAPESRVSFN